MPPFSSAAKSPHAGLSGAQDTHYETKEQRGKGCAGSGPNLHKKCPGGRQVGSAWVPPVCRSWCMLKETGKIVATVTGLYPAALSEGYFGFVSYFSCIPF